MNQIRNVHCGIIRRLERLETRLGVDRKHRIRVGFYDRSLIRRPHSDDNRTEAEQTIQVVFLRAAGNQRL